MVSTCIDLSMNLNNFCAVSISISISYSITVSNGNRTKWSPIRSVIIRVSVVIVSVSVSISIIIIVIFINIIILSFLVEEESILIISSCFAPTMHPLNATRLFLLKNINDYDISFLE